MIRIFMGIGGLEMSYVDEALAKVAEGDSTKILIPSNMEGIASFGTVINEMINKDKKEK